MNTNMIEGTDTDIDNNNNSLAELKRKKYKLTGGKSTSTNNNKNSDDYNETIHLNVMSSSTNRNEINEESEEIASERNASKTFNNTNNNNSSSNKNQSYPNANSYNNNNNSSSSKNPQSFLFKLDNFLDLNLKFKSKQMEDLYSNSFMPVTRTLFLNFLFYLILFCTVWIVYLCSFNNRTPLITQTSTNLNITRNNNNNSNNHDHIESSYLSVSYISSGYINKYSFSILNSTEKFYLNEIKYTNDLNNNNDNDEMKSQKQQSSSSSDIGYIIYLSVITFIFTIIFICIFFIEFKENRLRRLQKKLQRQEKETKVDIKKAESDLKQAMEKVIEKESEYKQLKEKLNSKLAKCTRLTSIYARVAYVTALFVLVCMFALCFSLFFISSQDNSSIGGFNQIGHFIWFCQFTIILYLIYPFQMFITLVTGIFLSFLFEIFAIQRQINTISMLSSSSTATSTSSFNTVYLQSQIIIFIFIKILLHSCIHLLGCYLKLNLQGVKRDTFLKVAHMHKAHMTAQQDKDITTRMIKSIMPPLFTHVFGKPEEFKKSVNCVHMMRPLFIYPVNELSILFADIVGFTRMSSSKTAEQLVFLLNDLYGRFDRLCEQTGCEKISTLGDCYYCVSGCLNGRKDHANCCVEMGLLMVKEIELFNKAHGVDVNMRVGVHTGNALCGFIGGKRFRFDVWSGDVTLANKMESSGRAGWVHISEDTYKHLDDKYNTELGEKYSGKNTYFVVRESKRETVADALKLNESMLTAGSSNNDVSMDTVNLNNRKLSTQSLTGPSQPQQMSIDEDNLLLLAVKETQFFKPDVNPITLRFNRNEEVKFQSYLVGHSNQSLHSHHHYINNQHETTPNSSLTNKTTQKNSKSVWIYPQNTLFLSILVSFIINVCVSTAFFLTFIVSSMTSYEYKLTTTYKINFVVILTVLSVLFVAQIIFFFIYFVQCSKLMNKNSKKSNNSFEDGNNTFSEMNSSSRFAAGGGTSSGVFSGNQRYRNSKENPGIKIRYFILHLVSLILLSIIPIFILTTGLPVLCNIIGLSWSALYTESTPNSASLVTASPSITSTNSSSSTSNTKRLNLFSVYLYFTYTVSLLHFCSFVQISSLLKTLVALIFALIFGIISFVGISPNQNVNNYQLQQNLLKNISDLLGRDDTMSLNDVLKDSLSVQKSTISFAFYTTLFVKDFLRENFIIILDVLLLIFLIWIVNRQSELIQRLSFKYDQDAQLKVTYAREQKELANWLIEVVLPTHVVSHVKEKKQYSRNYECVGVLFVSLCNFGEFFEESYEGGRELLRVLNEITVDFDRLFDEPKYRNVEKIKSIGSTFMIASGLCPSDDDNDEAKKNDISHLYDLIDFALELNEKLDAFNSEAMSVCHFKFQMRMGFNCGPVTAGVIGTDRLLYDIWGDTVNVASRMDSTGQANVMQTPEKVATMLQTDYKFTKRGPIPIKGKDEMITYFMDPKENKKVNLNS